MGTGPLRPTLGYAMVVIAHEDYSQYYVSIEQKLYYELTDLVSALFYLLCSHYFMNLA